MRIVGVREVKEGLANCLSEAQQEHVLITRHGKPVALVVGVQGQDLEDVYWGTHEELLETIEKRRKKSQTVSHEEARRRLHIPRK